CRSKLYINHHDFSVKRVVKKFPSVAAPARVKGALARHLPFASGRRKVLDIDLEPARLVRGVSDPLRVGRQPGEILIKIWCPTLERLFDRQMWATPRCRSCYCRV